MRGTGRHSAGDRLGTWLVRAAAVVALAGASVAGTGSAGAREVPPQSMRDSVGYVAAFAPARLAPHYGCSFYSTDRFSNVSRIWLMVTSPRMVAPARRLARRAGNSDRISIRVIPKRFGDNAMGHIYEALARRWPGGPSDMLRITLHHPYGDPGPVLHDRCPGWEILLFQSQADGPFGDWARSAVARYGADRVTLSVVPDGTPVPTR